MELLVVMTFFILVICTPITIGSYCIRKKKGQDTKKQLKYLKRQGISYIILILFAFSLSSSDDKETDKQIENTLTPVPTVCTESEEEYKLTCEEYTYKSVLRNSDEYVGKRVKITIKVSSVHEESWLNSTKYYIGFTESEYGWYGDRYGIFDTRENTDFKILSDDIITVYGEIASPQYTSSLIVNSEEIFCIEMKYIDLISE